MDQVHGVVHGPRSMFCIRPEKTFPTGNFLKFGCSSRSCPHVRKLKNWKFPEMQTGIFGWVERRGWKILKYPTQNNNDQLIQSNGCNETISRCVATFELQIHMCSSVVYLRSEDTTSAKVFSSLLTYFYILSCNETQILGYVVQVL